MPKISVVIPMFNAEEFIEPCLQSLLDQTFGDFEVIVVDDASTDRSVSIVEKIAPKFDGRLILVKRPQNSGGIVAIPRNIGLDLAHGDFVSFLDNDDLLIPTALETLHSIALDTQADVLNSSHFYRLTDDRREIVSFEKCPPVENVTVVDYDLEQRVSDFVRYCFHVNIWTKFFSRRFLVENQLRFPILPASDDMFFSFCCLMHAERYVRIPDAFYVWRARDDSVSHERLTPEREVHKRLSIVLDGVRYLEKFMADIEFFNQNPRFRLHAISMFVQDQFGSMRRAYRNLPVYVVHEIIRSELAKHPADNSALLAILISILNVTQFRMKRSTAEIEYLREQLAAFERGGNPNVR